MVSPAAPRVRPTRPFFSSGPCAKRPGWTVDALSGALVGRSHRSAAGRARLAEVIERSRRILGLPDAWRLGIVPASDTGAVEAALWSLLGPRGVDLLAWESFGAGWVSDVTDHLRIADARVLSAEYGDLPDLAGVDFSRDVVFAWNGTTSGVRVPDGDWIDPDRGGLTICDATSAVFALDIPWDRLDVATWSWQKAMGGEAAHGMIALGPRAVERLASHTPPWPVPKIFRLAARGAPIEGIFRGETINTPSMICVEDALDGLRWAEEIGGLDGLMARTAANMAVLETWVGATRWVDFLAATPATARRPRSASASSIPGSSAWTMRSRPPCRGASRPCSKPRHRLRHQRLPLGAARAPPVGRATVEKADLEALCAWLDWAYERIRHGEPVAA